MKQFLFTFITIFLLAACGQSQPVNIPAKDAGKPSPNEAVAYFAEGCFWHAEIVFQSLVGVRDAVSGYAGGTDKHPDYERVCSGTTGHAETVQVFYDPSKISFATLVSAFFASMDPTELNRQGPDVGPQYRSTIFVGDDEQARLAKAYIDQLDAAKSFGRKIATTLERDRAFYPAEDYHQNFLTLNPTYPYIVYNDLPKIENLKHLFPKDYRDDPVLVKVSSN